MGNFVEHIVYNSIDKIDFLRCKSPIKKLKFIFLHFRLLMLFVQITVIDIRVKVHFYTTEQKRREIPLKNDNDNTRQS